MRCFTESRPELRVSELSQRLDLNKSTVSRILGTLQKEGWVSLNPDSGKYRLGLGLISLAGVALGRLDVRGVSQPYLNDLVAATGETVNVTVLDAGECVNIERARSPQPIRYVGWIGRRTPIHCTAAGKVLLAGMKITSVETFLARPLVPYTDKTIVDRSTLQSSLAQIRSQGFAIVHEEFEEGFSAIAAPVCDHTGQVVAAISVSGPTYRMGDGVIENYIEPLLKISGQISAGMGHIRSQV